MSIALKFISSGPPFLKTTPFMITEGQLDGAHRLWRDDPQAADDCGLCCHRRGWGSVVVTDHLCSTALFCREAGVGVDQLFTRWGKNRFTIVRTRNRVYSCVIIVLFSI